MADKTIQSETPVTKGGFFKKFYGKAQEVIDLARAPLVRAAIKRQLQSAFADVEIQKMDAKKTLDVKRLNFQDYPLNDILEVWDEIDALERAQKFIRREYLEMFGKELVPQADEEDDD